MDIRVINVEDDGCVWVSEASREKLFQLEETAASTAQSLMESNNRMTFMPNRGEVCAVRWNHKWRRGLVEKLFISSKYHKIAQVFLFDHGVTVTLPLGTLVSLESSHISREQPLATKYRLSPLSADPVTPTQEEAWSEIVKDILRTLCSSVDEWGYLMKGEFNEDGSLHLLYSNDEGHNVSVNQLLMRRELLLFKKKDIVIKDDIEDMKEVAIPYLTSSSPSPSPPSPPCSSSPPSSPLSSPSPPPSSSPPPLINSPSYPLITKPPKPSYLENLKIYQPPTPRPVNNVFIDGIYEEHVLWPTLEDTPFHSSACKSLKERGFQFPTPVQSNSWYYVWNSYNVIMCSPHHSGKTLSYLLPLLCLSCQKEKEGTEKKKSYEPEIIVLVSGSYEAWNIADQAKTILTWFDAAKRFRTSALYATVESEAHVNILNGVDILVATPPALARLVKREVIAFRSTRHLVLDDFPSLFDKFSSEVNELLVCCIAKGKQTGIPLQLVGSCSSYCEDHYEKLLKYVKAPVQVVTDITDLIVMKKVKMSVLCCELDDLQKKLLSVLKGLAQSGRVIVCVEGSNEIQKILEVFGLYSLAIAVWREDSPQSFGNITVISDSLLPKLLALGDVPVISSLINYSLPSSKTVFKRRLFLLFSSIASGSLPSLVLLVSPQCFLQSSFILQLCERLQATPPPQLVSMATGRRKEQRQNSPFWRVCHQVKCYGRCRISDCNQIHTHEELEDIKPSKLSQVTVPSEGIVKVVVEAVASPCHIWVRIIDHAPLRRGETPYQPSTLTLTQISMDLGLHYSDSNNRILHGQPSIGDYVCLNLDSGTCYRALVLDFSRPLGLFFHHKEQAKVRLVDIGKECIVDVNQLYTLPLSFLATPPLVVEAFLCGLLPPDHDNGWPPSSIEIAQTMLLGSTLTGGIALSLLDSIWLDPVEERLELQCVGVVTAVERPQRRFIRNGISLDNSDHVNMIKEKFVYEKNTKNYPVLQDIGIQTPPSGCGLRVKLTAVESPSHFYVQLSSAEKSLEDITDQLNRQSSCEYLLHSLCPTFPIEVGVVCAARFPFDSKWYRAVVMEKRVNEGGGGGGAFEYLCFFGDYGDCEWVNEKCVQPIDNNLLQLPFQVLCCSWNNPQRIVFSQEDLWNVSQSHLLNMKVVDADSAFCSSPFPPTTRYSVDLETEDGSDLLSLLPTNQNASCERDEPVPSEITFLLILLLSNEGEEMVSSFLPFVLSKRGQIELTASNCDMLTECLNERSSSEFIDGLTLIASVCHNSGMTMGNNGDFCGTLLSKLKTSSEIQFSVLQLLYTLFLCTNCISLAYDELRDALCEMILTERNGPLYSLCTDFLACLTAVKKVIITEDMAERLFSTDEEQKSSCVPVRLACSLLHSSEGCRTLAPYLPQILQCFQDYPEKLKESLLFSLFISTFICPLLLRFHTTSIASSLKPSLLSSLGQLLSFKDISELVHIDETSHSMLETSLETSVDESLIREEMENNVIEKYQINNTVNGISSNTYAYLPQVNTVNTTESLVPSVLWSQNKSQVTLNIPLRGCSEHHIDMKEQSSSITASCKVEGKLYKFTLDLFDNIDQMQSQQGGSGVVIKLEKSRFIYWPRLTSCKTRPSFVGLDHDRWKDSSSSDEEEERRAGASLWRELDNSGNEGEISDERACDSDFGDDDELLDFLPS